MRFTRRVKWWITDRVWDWQHGGKENTWWFGLGFMLGLVFSILIVGVVV